MSTFLIPLVNVPQVFQINLAGVDYNLTCKWNDAFEAGWVMDIADTLTNTSLMANIPLVTGTDLLSGLEYLGIQGQLYVQTDANPFAVPTLTNLGIESNLYFVSEVVNG